MEGPFAGSRSSLLNWLLVAALPLSSSGFSLTGYHTGPSSAVEITAGVP